MPKEKMLWSLNGLSSVRSSKLREFRIVGQNTLNGFNYSLTGMFNKTDCFEFGIFDTTSEALDYLIAIHQVIEGSGK